MFFAFEHEKWREKCRGGTATFTRPPKGYPISPRTPAHAPCSNHYHNKRTNTTTNHQYQCPARDLPRLLAPEAMVTPLLCQRTSQRLRHAKHWPNTRARARTTTMTTRQSLTRMTTIGREGRGGSGPRRKHEVLPLEAKSECERFRSHTLH